MRIPPLSLRPALLGLGLLAGAAVALAVAVEPDGPAVPTVNAGYRQPRGWPAVTAYRPPANPQIWAIVQDQQGLLYFANRDGVLQFDGSNWGVIPPPNLSTVRSLAVDAKGRVFAGAQAELGYLAPGTDGRLAWVSLLDRVPSADRRAFSDVWKTHAIGDSVYFQANDRLFRWREGEPEMRVWRPARSFHFSYVVGERLYVLARGAGLERLDGDDLVPVPGGEAFAADRVYAVLPFPGGVGKDGDDLLIVTRDRGLFRLLGGRVERLPTAVDGELIADQPYHAIALPDGSLAIATLQGGVFQVGVDGTLLAHYDRHVGLGDNDVKFLFLDRDHDLWLGMNSSAARLELFSPLSHFGRGQGLEGMVAAVREHQGRTYVATSAGVARLDPAAAREARFVAVDGVDSAAYHLEEVGGELFAATNDGVYAIDPAERPGEPDHGRLVASGTALYLLAPASTPSLLLVAELEGLRLLARPTPNGVWQERGMLATAREDLRTLVEEDGRVWAGTNHNGVLRLDFRGVGGARTGDPRTGDPRTGDPRTGDPRQATVERWGEEAGLPRGRISVSKLDGRVVFTSERGLLRYDAATNRFVPEPILGPQFADGSTWVTRLVEDRGGRAWLIAGRSSEWGGIRAIVAGHDAGEPALRRIAEGSYFALEPTADGRVWIGGVDGLILYDPRSALALPPARPTLLRQVVANETRALITDGVAAAAEPPALDWSENNLQVTAVLPSYQDVARNQFRFRLEGLDDRWSGWSAESVRTFPRLREGHYRLWVAGRDTVGRESPPTSFAFSVRPPWYRSPMAWVGYLLGAVLVVWAADRIRAGEHERRERTLAALVARRTHELAKSEERYRTLIDHASDLILAVDRSGRLHAVNRACEVTLGYRREELLGRKLQDLVPHRYLGLLFEWLTESDEFLGGTLELELERKDGGTVVVELATGPLPTAEGPPLLEAIGRDVTARRELEGRLAEAQKVEAVGRLAGGIADEFERILHRIGQHAGEATFGADADGDLSSFAHQRQVQRETERGAALTERLRSLAQRSQPPRRALDLARFLEESEGELRAVLGPRVALEVTTAPDLAPILADAPQLTEILRQLAANARDAMPAGGTFSLAADLAPDPLAADGRSREAVLIRCADTGCGMSEEILRHVFEPFFSTRADGEHSGLGLAIVYTLVHQGGGRISARSRPGQGTVFEILLPAASTP